MGNNTNSSINYIYLVYEMYIIGHLIYIYLFSIVRLKGMVFMYENNESLMDDILFKETFANKANRRQLEFLLEKVLEYPTGFLKDKLEVKYESPLDKNYVYQKGVRGDIIVRFDDTTVNIEAYTNFNQASLDKSLYYVMRIQANKLEIGDGYYELGKTIQINFVENSTLNLGDELVCNFYLTYERNSDVKIGKNIFNVKIVQIDKARKLGYTKNDLERWLKFIAAKNSQDRASIAKGDELLVELNEWVNKYVNDEETQEKLDKWDLMIARNKGKDEGYDLGKTEGYDLGKDAGKEEEKLKIAKKLLQTDMPLEKISDITGLSIEDIKQLKS